MNLLSIDWDFFFNVPTGGAAVQLYDWGHSEKMPFLLGPIWHFRAAGFLAQGIELPIVKDWERIWGRFNIPKDATLFYAESHSQATHREILERVQGKVVNFDAHHDLGYSDSAVRQLLVEGRVDCANWLLAYGTMLGVPTEVVLPFWQDKENLAEVPKRMNNTARLDDGRAVDTPFSTIFVARSGSWVPSWCDEQFDEFIAACPASNKVDLHERLLGRPLERRSFDMEEARGMAEGQKVRLEEIRARMASV